MTFCQRQRSLISFYAVPQNTAFPLILTFSGLPNGELVFMILTRLESIFEVCSGIKIAVNHAKLQGVRWLWLFGVFGLPDRALSLFEVL